MSKKYLDTVGLNKLVANILSKFASKNHSHSNATTNSAGFMSSSDKVKLDGVAAGANKTIVDSSLNGTSTNAIQNKAVKTALDGKASSSHTHPTAQITGLDSALAGKASASHKHDAGDITSGILPIGRGGTGAGTADAALKNLMDNCTVGGTAAPSDDLWYFTANLDAAQPPVKRKHSALWSYIKSKTDPLYQPRGSYAAASHTHSISNITNLQSQLDSKQPKGSYAASSHTHTISNVTNLQTELDKKQVKIQPVTTSGTGSAYTATVPHIKALTAGMKFTMIPHVVSAAVSPTLNVNNLGAKPIRQRLSNSTQSTVTGAEANWLAAGNPVDVMYDGQFWVVDFVRPNMASAYGVLPVANGGTGGSYSIKTVEVKHTFIKGQDDKNVRLRQEINANNPVIFGTPSIRDSIGGQSDITIYSYEIGSFEYRNHWGNGTYTMDISFQYEPNPELPTGLRIELDIVVPFIEIARY